MGVRGRGGNRGSFGRGGVERYPLRKATTIMRASPTKTVYPIQRVAMSAVFDEAELAMRSNGALWQLQRAIAEGRFQMLQKMLEACMYPIPGRDTLRVVLQMERSCLPIDHGLVDVPETFSHYVTATTFGAH